ncbi:hypothetical protein Sango_2337700 [Sesamum angolense]|uniref:Small ribosomal subunit protein bS18c n=1 Tax=Sesamum angolense TaxID=2727404 RepID=A0AAE1W5U6_9LAMI|nr:hypothetical protein Sango_2337700 [Sesamum angolense]
MNWRKVEERAGPASSHNLEGSDICWTDCTVAFKRHFVPSISKPSCNPSFFNKPVFSDWLCEVQDQWSLTNLHAVEFYFVIMFHMFQLLEMFAVGTDNGHNMKSSESVDDFEQRIFSDGNRPSLSSFYQKLDRAEKAHDRSGTGFSFTMGNRSESCTYFEFDPDEVAKEDYAFRPDVNFLSGMNYDIKDLDLRKPGVQCEISANFITEAGIIIKRSKTGISAKAQRKVAREIKTARAFGLMPFTTMGTKQFIYGTTMEDEDRDFEYHTYDHSFVNDDRGNTVAT